MLPFFKRCMILQATYWCKSDFNITLNGQVGNSCIIFRWNQLKTQVTKHSMEDKFSSEILAPFSLNLLWFILSLNNTHFFGGLQDFRNNKKNALEMWHLFTAITQQCRRQHFPALTALVSAIYLHVQNSLFSDQVWKQGITQFAGYKICKVLHYWGSLAET